MRGALFGASLRATALMAWSCATWFREPCQVRKEAAVSGCRGRRSPPGLSGPRCVPGRRYNEKGCAVNLGKAAALSGTGRLAYDYRMLVVPDGLRPQAERLALEIEAVRNRRLFCLCGPINNKSLEVVEDILSKLNGVKELALSKVDVLEHVKELKVCAAYRLDGREIEDFYEALSRIEDVKPVYRELKPLLHAEMTDGRFPRTVESFIELLEEELKARISLVSYGEERSRTIER